jgi:hypothetical protein
MSTQGMLLLTASVGHLTLDMRSDSHDELYLVILGHMTSYLHILVNIPFNDQIKQMYSEWLLEGQYVLTSQDDNEPSVKLLYERIKTMEMVLSISAFKYCIFDEMI